jgi:phage tail sheath protein FI
VTATASAPQPGGGPPLTTVTLTPLTVAGFPRVYESDVIEVIEAEVGVRYEEGASDPDVDRDEPEVVEEVFPGLRLDQLTGTLRSIVDFVNAESTLVRLEVVPPTATVGWGLFPGRPSADNNGWIPLTSGDDQLEALQPTDFVGTDGGPGRRTGIQALEDIEEISICAAPGMWSRTVQSALIGHCELLKDRFAVLDAQRGLNVQGVLAFRSPLDSKFAALYHPWLKVVDPLTAKDVVVPPSGHMTGVYAFVDNDRGVHKAPANVVIQQIVGFDDDINTREQDLLNPVGINALREFPFRGLRVWGARTLSSVPEWRYLNVRRLFIFIEDSIKQGTQWVVFEPNAEPLWALVTQAVTNFLDTVWRTGALEGVKQEEAFFVRCDRSTMTEDDIANGRLIVQIGIAPVKPAEFVIFRFRQKTREQVAVA